MNPGACVVCNEGDSREDNQIIYCDGPGCDIPVHQECYGVPQIPEGKWFCSRCKAGLPVKKTECALCPKTGGAMKPTTDGRWVHIVCALYHDFPRFEDEVTMEPIKIPKKITPQKCDLCDKLQGATVQCKADLQTQCPRRMHATCAQEEDLLVEKMEKDATVSYLIYCPQHRKIYHQPLGRNGSVGSSSQNVRMRPEEEEPPISKRLRSNGIPSSSQDPDENEDDSFSPNGDNRRRSLRPKTKIVETNQNVEIFEEKSLKNESKLKEKVETPKIEWDLDSFESEEKITSPNPKNSNSNAKNSILKKSSRETKPPLNFNESSGLTSNSSDSNLYVSEFVKQQRILLNTLEATYLRHESTDIQRLEEKIAELQGIVNVQRTEIDQLKNDKMTSNATFEKIKIDNSKFRKMVFDVFDHLKLPQLPHPISNLDDYLDQLYQAVTSSKKEPKVIHDFVRQVLREYSEKF